MDPSRIYRYDVELDKQNRRFKVQPQGLATREKIDLVMDQLRKKNGKHNSPVYDSFGLFDNGIGTCLGNWHITKPIDDCSRFDKEWGVVGLGTFQGKWVEDDNIRTPTREVYGEHHTLQPFGNELLVEPGHRPNRLKKDNGCSPSQLSDWSFSTGADRRPKADWTGVDSLGNIQSCFIPAFATTSPVPSLDSALSSGSSLQSSIVTSSIYHPSREQSRTPYYRKRPNQSFDIHPEKRQKSLSHKTSTFFPPLDTSSTNSLLLCTPDAQAAQTLAALPYSNAVGNPSISFVQGCDSPESCDVVVHCPNESCNEQACTAPCIRPCPSSCPSPWASPTMCCGEINCTDPSCFDGIFEDDGPFTPMIAETPTKTYNHDLQYINPSDIMLDVNLSDLSGHTSMSSESPNEQHLCKWIVNHSTGKQCGLGFKDPNELQIHAHATHVKSQPRDQPLSCGWSGCTTKRKLTDKTILGRHVKMHTGYRGATCTMCGARLAHNFALDCHMRGVHSDEKPYQCNVCFEKFAHRNLYTIHMHRHTGEKPFKCDYPGCTYASADSSNLSHHKKTHYDPTYRCDYCPLKFKKPSGLKRHMMTHVLYKAEVEAEAMILFESTASSSLGN